MATITVNSVAWPEPDQGGYRIIEEGNLAPGAARSATTADLLGEFVAYVHQLVLPFAMLTGAQLRSMYNSTAAYLPLSVTFFNYYTGAYQTENMYIERWDSTQATGEYPDDWFSGVTITLTGIRGYER